MTDLTKPSGGGSYIRLKDGTLQRELPPGEAAINGPDAAVQAPVEEAVKPAAKRSGKET
jgi:hypothetical protein